MRNRLMHWSLLGLVLVWALSHATVFGQQNKSATEKIRQGLDKTITIDYSGQSLAEVLAHLRDKTALPINVDQFTLLQMGINLDDNIGQFRLQGTNEKVGQILRRMLNNARLTYIVYEDSVLITTEEMAVSRQLRQRVSIDLEEVPFKKAVRDLAKNHGINLVLDPKMAKQTETPVSLQLESVGIETTLRLLAELANLKAVRMGNVIFVTSEDRAKKIREEEPHHMDNPNNPMPGFIGPPMAVGGFPGGGGGFMPGGGVRPPQAIPVLPMAIAPAGFDQPRLPEVKKVDGDAAPMLPKNKPRVEPNVPAPSDPAQPPVIQNRPVIRIVP